MDCAVRAQPADRNRGRAVEALWGARRSLRSGTSSASAKKLSKRQWAGRLRTVARRRSAPAATSARMLSSRWTFCLRRSAAKALLAALKVLLTQKQHPKLHGCHSLLYTMQPLLLGNGESVMAQYLGGIFRFYVVHECRGVTLMGRVRDHNHALIQRGIRLLGNLPEFAFPPHRQRNGVGQRDEADLRVAGLDERRCLRNVLAHYQTVLHLFIDCEMLQHRHSRAAVGCVLRIRKTNLFTRGIGKTFYP